MSRDPNDTSNVPTAPQSGAPAPAGATTTSGAPPPATAAVAGGRPGREVGTAPAGAPAAGSLADAGTAPTTAAESEVRARELGAGGAAHGTRAQMPTRAGLRGDNTPAPESLLQRQADTERRAFLGLNEDGEQAENPDDLPVSLTGETVGQRNNSLRTGGNLAGGRPREDPAGGETPPPAGLPPEEAADPVASALNTVQTLPHAVSLTATRAVIPEVAEEVRVGDPVKVDDVMAAGRVQTGGVPAGTQLVVDLEAGTASLVADTEGEATPPITAGDAGLRDTAAGREGADATALQRVAVPPGPATDPGAAASGTPETKTP